MMKFKVYFFLFFLLFVIFPVGVGIKFGITLRLWTISSLIFLLPVVLKCKIKYDRIDIIIFLLTVFFSIPQFFLKDLNPLGVFVERFSYIFIPFLFFRYAVESYKHLIFVLKIVIFGALIVEILGIIEFSTGFNFLDYASSIMVNKNDFWQNGTFRYNRSGLTRIVSSFNQPIYLGVFSLFVVLICLLIYLREIENFVFPKLLLFYQIIIGSIVSILSQSRTAIIAFMMAFCLFLFGRLKSSKTIVKIVFILLVSSSILYFYFSDFLMDSYSKNVSGVGAEDNWIYRVEAITSSVNLFFVNFIGESLKDDNNVFMYLFSTDMLNGFLNSYLFYGMFYSIFYLFIWISSLIHSFKKIKISSIAVIPFYSLFYFFIVNNITALSLHNEVIFYMIVGLGFNDSIYTKNNISSL